MEYKAGYFVISCSPRTSHFVNLNLQTGRDIRIKKKNEDVSKPEESRFFCIRS